MSDSLPDTLDPWELLGVPADSDRRTVKRAHARLIKRHRPDRDPESFKRVQAAFEECTRRLKMRERFAGLTVVYGSDSDSADSAANSADSDASRADTAGEPAPPAPKVWPAEPDQDFLGSPVEWVLRGVRSGLPLDGAALDALSPAEFAQLAAHDDLGWRTLRAPALAEVARPLHRGRMERLLLDGKIDQALGEASDEPTRNDALSDHELETHLWMVAAMAAWDRPDEAAALARSLGGATAGEDDRDPQSVYDDVRRVALPWRHFLSTVLPTVVPTGLSTGRSTAGEPGSVEKPRKPTLPRALASYIRSSRVMGYRNTDLLLRACRAELMRDREGTLRFLDELARHSDALASFVHGSIALDVIDSLSRSPSGARADELDDALARCEAELATSAHVRRARLAPAWVVAFVAAAVAGGGWAWLLPLAGTPAVMVRMRRRWADAYQLFRRQLLDVATDLGVPAAVVRERISVDGTRYRTLNELVDRVETDAGLSLATEMAALTDQWTGD